MQSRLHAFVPLLTIATLLGFSAGFASRSPSALQGPCATVAAPGDQSGQAMFSLPPGNSQEQTTSWVRWPTVTDF
jgi:hypothetical protein